MNFEDAKTHLIKLKGRRLPFTETSPRCLNNFLSNIV